MHGSEGQSRGDIVRAAWQFSSEVDLVVANAKKYNAADTEIYRYANELMSDFKPAVAAAARELGVPDPYQV